MKRRSGLTLCLTVALLSCGGADSDSETTRNQDPEPDTTVVEQEADAHKADDPFYGFDLDRVGSEDREEKLLALRLRNDGTEDAVVFADAGAGEVFLDSVEAGGWSRVDLVTRGPDVQLRTARTSGEAIQRLDLAVVPDSVIEVSLGKPAVTP